MACCLKHRPQHNTDNAFIFDYQHPCHFTSFQRLCHLIRRATSLPSSTISRASFGVMAMPCGSTDYSLPTQPAKWLACSLPVTRRRLPSSHLHPARPCFLIYASRSSGVYTRKCSGPLTSSFRASSSPALARCISRYRASLACNLCSVRLFWVGALAMLPYLSPPSFTAATHPKPPVRLCNTCVALGRVQLSLRRTCAIFFFQ